MNPPTSIKRIREHFFFIRQFIKQPVSTGAIAPSSRGLAERITNNMGLEEADTVVELGPGTGVFTRAIAEKVRPGALVLAIEGNPGLAESLKKQFSGVTIICDSAERIVEHLAAVNRASADCIISGIPWAGFSQEHQQRLLSSIIRAMRPGGCFATFAYLNAAWFSPGRRFRRMLYDNFSRVTTTRTVWGNLPPAFVYRCEK